MNKTKQLNDLSALLSFKSTWPLKKFMRLPHRITTLFCGNQSMKTSSVCFQYVMRVLGHHPVPKKNVVYFECKKRDQDNIAPHGYYEFIDNGVRVRGWEKGTWNIKTLPKDGRCPYCGEPILIHQRLSNKIRLCAETLPGDKESVSDDGTQTAETKNTIYPELKKWMPPFLVKRDITFRNPAMIIKDPLKGMTLNGSVNKGNDIIFDFVSYSQSIQAGAGVQRLSTYCVAEGQRVLMSDGIWRNIEKLQKGDELVCEALGGYGSRQKVNTIKQHIYTGLKDVYRFNCQKGINFKVTSDHKVMIPKQGMSGYKKAKYLEVGDRVTCKTSDIEGKNTLEIWQIALLGFYLGDGCWGKTIKFTCGNEKIIKSLEKHLPDFLYFRKQNMPADHVPDYFLSSKQKKNEFKEFLIKLGLKDKKAGTKFVPDIIFKQNKKNIALFLSYLYAADGWANGATIGYCSTSYRLAQDVFLLLRRLGIRSTVNKRTFQNNWNPQYWVGIYANYDVTVFSKQIKLIGKQHYLDKVVLEAEKKRTRKYNCSSFTSNDVPEFKAKRLLQSVKIKSIEHIGKKRVYDISMERGGWDEREKAGIKKQRATARSPRNNFLIQGGVVVHNCDEEPPKDFWDEQIPRLLKEDGDLLLGLTPAQGLSWTYDEIFEKAQIYYRTPKVCEFLNKTEKDKNYKQVEVTDSPNPIAVIQAATDDNPTLSPQVIDEMFAAVDDPDVLATRRFGIHKQVSGRIFKIFDYKVHYIDFEKYFPTGMFHDWNHYRMIDYHPHNKWACVWLSISPYNEAFVWQEWSPDPEKIITRLIVNEMALISGDYKFNLNLIDALAAENQPGSGTSTLEDLNDLFLELKREGICTGGFFETWDTKGVRGREVVRERLKYAKDCKRPFNNKVQHQGVTRYLPTLWISNRCPETARSLKQWRLENRIRAASNVDKDRLERPTQKFSHFCTAIEAAFKDKRVKPPSIGYKPQSKQAPKYFQGSHRVYG